MDFYTLIKKSYLYKKPFVLCTVISAKGSTPQVPGARMSVFADGSLLGTVGGGCVEGNVIKESIKMIAKKKSNNQKIINVDLTSDIEDKDGDVCGGNMKILLEFIENYNSC